MACVSTGTYFAISSLRSARMSRSGRMSVSEIDSSRERHFISTNTPEPSAAKAEFRIRLSGTATAVPFPEPQLHSRQLHPRHPSGETGLAHLLEHLFHLRVLAEQVIHFLHGGSGAAGDAFAAAAVDHFVVIALMHGHRVDDGLDAVDLFFVHAVGSFLEAGKRTDRGQHAHQAFD